MARLREIVTKRKALTPSHLTRIEQENQDERDKENESALTMLMDYVDQRLAGLEAKINQLVRAKLYTSHSVQTIGGGDTMVISIPGVKVPMSGFAVISKQGALPVTVIAVTTGKDQITIKFSADPSSDHQVSYLVTHT